MRLLVLLALLAALAVPVAAANACDRNPPGTATAGLLMQRTTLAVAYASAKPTLKPKRHAARAMRYSYYR